MELDVTGLTTVVRLAEQFGPFLFAILFILVVTKTAHGYYQDANTRKHPPASQQERQTYRFYFLCSIWCGVGVMVLSIAWWLYVQSRGSHVYQIAITALGNDDNIYSGYYNKRLPRPLIPGLPGTYDTYFLVVQDQPFNVGDKFSFTFVKVPAGGGPGGESVGVAGVIVPKQITVTYRGERFDTYTLSFDGDVPKLIAVASDERAQRTVFTADEIKRVASRSQADLPAGGR